MSLLFITLNDFKDKFKQKRLNPILEQSHLDQASDNLCDLALILGVDVDCIEIPLANLALNFLKAETYQIAASENSYNSESRRQQNASPFSPNTDFFAALQRDFWKQRESFRTQLNHKILTGDANPGVERTGVQSLRVG